MSEHKAVRKSLMAHFKKLSRSRTINGSDVAIPFLSREVINKHQIAKFMLFLSPNEQASDIELDDFSCSHIDRGQGHW